MLHRNLYYSYFHTGSNYICDPPVTDTDIDYMYMVYNIERVSKHLEQDGWKQCVNSYIGCNWKAFRKDNINILFTDDKDYYDKFEAATELAKKRNLTSKEDRISLFNTICGKEEDTIGDQWEEIVAAEPMPVLTQGEQQEGNRLWNLARW